MKESPDGLTHKPRTKPVCAVSVLRHSLLGKLHSRIYKIFNVKYYKVNSASRPTVAGLEIIKKSSVAFCNELKKSSRKMPNFSWKS